MSYTVGLYTLGCKVSQYETEAIAERFEERGFTVRPFDELCDAYVINTCTVTAESDRKSRQFIRRAIKQNPEAVVAVVGCYSQRAPRDIEKIEGADIIFGTADKLAVVAAVERRLGNREGAPVVAVGDISCAHFEPMRIRSAPRTRAYIKIEDGCDSKCTYCAIAAARGRVRSKPPAEVIAEVEALYAGGAREIVLTGIETAAYGRDFDDGYTLGDLIRELDARGSCERLRLGSLAPELMGERFCEKVAGVKILAPHFHLSMQSGSDRVLAAMRRRYNAAGAIANIERLRALFRGAEFTTDMMVGFPGESEEDFAASLDFIRTARFLDVHVFAYSKRAGTPAATYPCQLSEAEKHERSRAMISVKNEVRDSRLDALVAAGEPLSAIVETCAPSGYCTAHADNFAELAFRAPRGAELHGALVAVRPVSHKDGIIHGEYIENINNYLHNR